MLFNSYPFIFVYLPIVFCGYFLLAKYKKHQMATIFLVLSSLAFYSYWDIRYLPLLCISICVNYSVARRLEDHPGKWLLAAGIFFNFALLGYYKYTGFFCSIVNDVFETGLAIPKIILPLGISFFTFTQTAYLVDVYRGETQRPNFYTYALFVTIFPHLIAGPIIYHKNMIPQFSKLQNFILNYDNIAKGLMFFSIGLFKKTVIADQLSPWVGYVFSHAGQVSFLEAWAGAIAYALQIYYDFSGYSEMAIGLGLFFNFKLPVNFNVPYKALSFVDFWRRWHMTLTDFLRNYIYISLGGNRRGRIRQFINTMLTFLFSGLWHGAGWTFIFWGGLNGLFVIISHLWHRHGRPLPKFLAWVLTFGGWILIMVIFRAADLKEAAAVLKAMFTVTSILPPNGYDLHLGNLHFGNGAVFSTLAILTACTYFGKSIPERMEAFQPDFKWMLVAALLFVLSLLTFSGGVSEFLYFQF